MISAQITYFDMIVVAVMLLSCLFAFFRGFVKEVLSLGAWIGAGAVTLYYFRDVAAMLKPHFTNEMVAGGMATLGLYITALIGFSLLNSLIMRFIKEGSDVGVLDNSLGLVFGALRGAFIISLGYLLLSIAIPDDNEPKWLTASYTKPYAEEGALILARVAPDYLKEQKALVKKVQEAEEKKEAEGRHRETIQKRFGEESAEEKGYTRDISREMERFMRDINRE